MLEEEALALAYQMLQLNPMEMLSKYAVRTAGMHGAPAGIESFSMLKVPLAPSIKLPSKFKGNFFRKDGQQLQIKPTARVGLEDGVHFRFNAIHIPVQPSNIPYRPYPLNTDGPGLMITVQLTGCCIVMIPGDGTWMVAHLQPTGENGKELQARLAADRALAHAGVKVYGAKDYQFDDLSSVNAALIGVREEGNWNFYVQKRDMNSNVVSVKRLTA